MMYGATTKMLSGTADSEKIMLPDIKKDLVHPLLATMWLLS